MSINYAIIGGDLRIIKLAQMLADDKNTVYTYGLEKYSQLQLTKNIESCVSLEKTLQNANVVIGPIPFSNDGININAPFSNKKILIKELILNIKDIPLIAGSIKTDIYNVAQNNIHFIDIMKREELAILNAIATAEGAIEIAIANTEKIIHKANVLILGFGRIGKILAKKMEGLSCKITCSARKIEDLVWIQSYGYEPVNTNDLGYNLQKFDIIINTIPCLILNREKLNYIRKDSLLIDLASKPGGIDIECAREKGIKTIWALALPGKVAPVTSAEFIKDTIYNILKEEGDKEK